MKKNIDINKTYNIPKNISIVDVSEKILVISVDTAKWIVLNNQRQLDFFHLLRNNKLSDALNLFSGNINDAIHTITQIEAKKFELMEVSSCILEEVQTLHLYITNACNLRCPHCYMHSGNANEKELITSEIYYILDEFKSHGGTKVTMSGGEVTTRKDFTDIVKYAYDKGLSIRILTNGTLWSDSMINNVSQYINSIQISIDGYSEESNAKVRGKGNFKKSIKCIEKFIEQNIPVDVAITPFPDKALKTYTKSYADFAKTLTSKYTPQQLMIKFAEEIIEGRSVNLSSKQKTSYTSLINEIYTSYYGYNTFDLSFVKAFRKDLIMDNCMYGSISISSNGDVFFCSRISSLKSSINIRTHSFQEIFNLSKHAKEKANIKNLKPCNTCDLKFICGGGCRIDHFPELTNAPDISKLDIATVKPKQCSYEQKLYFYNLMIKNNEKLFQ